MYVSDFVLYLTNNPYLMIKVCPDLLNGSGLRAQSSGSRAQSKGQEKEGEERRAEN